ncbi:sensor histidine kinase [Bacillaceae bacterium W0354]
MLSNNLIPRKFIWRLTILNVIVIAAFIVLSGWAIYNTACFLVDGMNTVNVERQTKFNSDLFLYLWIYSLIAIIIGSVVHYYLVRRLVRPLKELIESTKQMKIGQYPSPIETKSHDEVGELITHFNDLVKQLNDDRKNRQKFISDLSHELKTPLSNLNGYLNALKSGVIKGDEELYRSLYQESERLSMMINQLEQLKELDYVSKQIFTEKETVDMYEVINQTVEMFRWSFKRSNIELVCDIEYGYVLVNQDGIQQVISNLIDNAIRYYKGDEPIKVVGRKQDRNYILTITGPGEKIDEEDKKRIFERFYRADLSRARETGGTGLGLAIAKEIIDNHRGRIGLHSRGNLHTFWFEIPYA